MFTAGVTLGPAFLTGAPFDALEARRIGLVDLVSDDVDATVAEVVEGVLMGAPAAVAATKQILRRVPALGRDDAYDEMRRLSEDLFAGPDAQEGIAALFAKRPPSWQRGDA